MSSNKIFVIANIGLVNIRINAFLKISNVFIENKLTSKDIKGVIKTSRSKSPINKQLKRVLLKATLKNLIFEHKESISKSSTAHIKILCLKLNKNPLLKSLIIFKSFFLKNLFIQ